MIALSPVRSLVGSAAWAGLFVSVEDRLDC
jgi:hypothetical protein